MEESEETVIERQAKMRERAKFLKDKRESERLSVVQEKYDQQFRLVFISRISWYLKRKKIEAKEIPKDNFFSLYFVLS